jgi:hypothetical protein
VSCRPFLIKMNQEGCVSDHLRPPDRRPRSRAMRLSMLALARLGGGSSSYASSNSPHVSSGLCTFLRITFVKESRFPCFKEQSSLYTSSSIVIVLLMHDAYTIGESCSHRELG